MWRQGDVDAHEAVFDVEALEDGALALGQNAQLRQRLGHAALTLTRRRGGP